MENTSPKGKKPAKKQNSLMNLLVNIAMPVIVLMKFSNEEALGPVNGLIVALAFPLVYGIYGFFREKKVNFFSVLGIDPYELRLRNANRVGDTTPNLVRLEDPSTVPTIHAVAEAAGVDLAPELWAMTSDSRSGELLPAWLAEQRATNGKGA